MKKIILVLVALVFCGRAPQAAANDCPNGNLFRCAKNFEAKLSREHPELFSRSGSKLVVTLRNGSKKTYINTADNEDPVTGKWYNFVQYYPEIGYALIAIHYYEGGAYYFVNLSSGKESEIAAFPVLSPDRKRIGVANTDLAAYFTPNILAVYALNQNGLVTEFIEKQDDWGAENIRWITNEELTFTKNTPDQGYGNIGTTKILKLRKSTNKWSIK